MMRLGLSSGIRRTAAVIFLAGGVAGLTYGGLGRLGVRVNASPSLPIGL